MGQSTNQIELEIEQQREELGHNLDQLENKAKALTDWRTYFEKSPATMLGAAFIGGVVIASMSSSGGRKSGPRHQSPLIEASSPQYDQIKETWDTVKDALVGVAATRVKDFVGEFIPGFHDQLRVSETKRRA